ncbi:universal stress protein [Oxalobacter paraformigenes]|uniref:UspA domain-containing protein n=1 Tax=Oxalobacter paraformigenes TaxID=556268 RepID=C3X6X9_9BURK|nr:universal stress protein [Oxalobacter paraformigenes]EEO26892.2 hypothetical protein OFAG_00045 [Oxalobacter paraformigenes]
MSYKTILVHLDKKSVAEQRIRIAANLAIAENACLVGAAMIGISTQTFHQAHIDEKDPVLASHLQFLHDRAGRFVQEFETEAKRMGVSSYEGRIVDGEANQGISLLARVADLVVIGRTNLEEKSPIVAPDFPEYVMMNAGRPVLIIPPSYERDIVGERVMICWNASRESIRAVADAIPILKKANLVQIVMYNVENEPDVNAELAGSDIALYLARHGINVEVLPPQKNKHIGNALLELAESQTTDLLVMGGYGHTRFREFLLGGVTRTVLGDSNIPVLMSH